MIATACSASRSAPAPAIASRAASRRPRPPLDGVLGRRAVEPDVHVDGAHRRAAHLALERDDGDLGAAVAQVDREDPALAHVRTPCPSGATACIASSTLNITDVTSSLPLGSPPKPYTAPDLADCALVLRGVVDGAVQGLDEGLGDARRRVGPRDAEVQGGRELQRVHAPALGDEGVVDQVDVEVAGRLERHEEQRVAHHLELGDRGDAVADGGRRAHDGVGRGQVARLAGDEQRRPRRGEDAAAARAGEARRQVEAAGPVGVGEVLLLARAPCRGRAARSSPSARSRTCACRPRSR